MSRAEHGPELNAARVFAALAKHGVDYVLIGGVAAQAHGQMRTTFDLDILPRPDGANLQRLARALQAIEARALKPGAEGLALDAQTLPRATIWQLSTRYGLIDVLH